MKMKIVIIVMVAMILSVILTNHVNADSRNAEIYGYCQTIGSNYSISPE